MHSDFFLITFRLKCIPFFAVNIMECNKHYIMTGTQQEWTTWALWVNEKMEDFSNV